MTMKLTQHEATTVTFFLSSDADYTAPATGASPVVNISKNGGSFNPTIAGAVEVANGFYSIALNATELDTLGPLDLYITGTGAVSLPKQFTVAADIPARTCVVTGAPAPTTTSVSVTGLATTEDDHWAGGYLYLVDGSGEAQVRKITGSAESGGTTTLTIAALATAPSASDNAIVIVG